MTTTSMHPCQDLDAREAEAHAAGDFYRRLNIDASPEAVHAAIASPEKWWTPQIEREVGQLTVSFGRGWTRFAVKELDWTVVAQNEPGLPEPDEWVGTTLSFGIYPRADGGTVLSFVHRGLTEQLACIELCRAGWERHLTTGLKPLAEADQPQPKPLAPTSVHHEALLDATPLEVYQYLTEGDAFSKATGMSTQLEPAEGSSFSIFDSRIEGQQIELVPGQRVVQAWRFGSAHPDQWEPGVYSVVRFTMTAEGDQTRLVIDHNAIPAEWTDHIAGGYPQFYPEPMSRYFAARTTA